MSKNRTNLLGALIAVGTIGATAGMLAWRWSQRHRAQRLTYHRELNRWEDEGGALASNAGGVAEADMPGAPMPGAPRTPGVSAPTVMTAADRPGPRDTANGAAGAPWPFPHGNA
jgi:hypothetical protein